MPQKYRGIVLEILAAVILIETILQNPVSMRLLPEIIPFKKHYY